MKVLELDSYKKFESYMKQLNYLVIYPDKEVVFFKSLRNISEKIYVDHSTIAKKLKNEDSCYVISKLNNYMYYIKKMQLK